MIVLFLTGVFILYVFVDVVNDIRWTRAQKQRRKRAKCERDWLACKISNEEYERIMGHPAP